ncbi:MAG: hypothetical protein LUE16_06190 [Lachnospiraceae bacterium]|nr:hypothetical protein [Lachnospiraceae bacterium]
MKKTKKFSKLLALALAVVMMMGMAVTASAAGVTGDGSSAVTSSITITKKVTTDGDTYKPNTTFTYTVKEAESGSYTDANGTTYTVLGGLIWRVDNNIYFIFTFSI